MIMSTNNYQTHPNICYICKTVVTTNHIKCSICFQLFHPRCAKVPINVLKDSHHAFNNWFCIDCSEFFPFNNLSNFELEILQNATRLNTLDCSNICKTIQKYQDINLASENDISINNFEANFDPDTNFYNSLTKECKYYCEQQFNINFKQVSGFSVIHFNARSLNANFRKIEQYLELLNRSFDIIAITETWETDLHQQINFLTDYTPYSVNRKQQRGGGVSIYVKNNLQCKLLDNLSDCYENLFECVTVEISHQSKRSTVISCIYRKPGTNITEFSDTLEELLNPLKHKDLYVCGDLNIDLLKYEAHDQTRNFMDMFFSLGLFPLITKPTRITNYSESLIDNIFTNVLNNQHRNGILITDVSDHLPIFTISESKKIPNDKPEYVICRKINDNTIKKLRDSLNNVDWSSVHESKNVNESYIEFTNLFMNCVNKCCPNTKVKLETKLKSKPWFSNSLKNACKKKNNLYQKFLKSRNKFDENRYKMYRNKLTAILRNCEKDYLDKQFENAKGDIKKTWSIINKLIKPANRAGQYKDLMSGDKTAANIANGFNDFFTNVGPRLASKIEPSAQSHDHFLKNRVISNMFIKPVTEDELISTVKNLEGKTSLDCLGVNMNLIKQIIPSIKNQLLDICNKSFEQGIFPDEMKTARVIPIFKSGNKTDFNNYRPISLLSQFSKILEKLFTTRLDSFLAKNDVLYRSQYGFQKNRSTSTAVIELLEEISNNIEQKNVTAGIFIDLKKAFDTVNHDILISKLEHYGLRGVAKSWIESYLRNRKQYVVIDGTESDKQTVHCGVPQGSVLGPKLFLLYVNDITNTSDLLKFILFADDTTILCSSSNIKNLITIINNELNNLCDWFAANKLSLNVSKTNYIIFNKNNNDERIHDPQIKIRDQVIEKVKVSKFLGLQIDDKLNWKQHISHVQTKLSKTIAIMCKMRHYLNENTLRTIYCSLYLPYLNYCSEIWGNTYKTSTRKIILSQKKAVRIICKAGRLDHSTPLFKKLKLLKFNDLVQYKTAITMHKVFYKQMPPNILRYFTPRQSNYASRHTNNFLKTQYRTNTKAHCMSIVGVNIWNNLHQKLTDINKLTSFKYKLKKDLLETYV